MSNYSRAGFAFDDKDAWVTRLQASFDTNLATIKSKLTATAWYAAKALGDSLVTAVAGVLAANDVNIGQAVDFIFPQWCPMNVLKLWGALLDLPSYDASFSGVSGVATVKVTGLENTVIPYGSVLTGNTGIQYQTKQVATLTVFETDSYYALIPVACLSVGSAGNATLGDEFSFSPAITGVSSATANATFTGGADAEGVESYRARIVARIAYPPVGGSAHDISSWAESLASVARAWTRDEYPMPGWATCYYTRSGGGGPVPVGSGAAFCLSLRAIACPISVYQIHVKKADLTAALGSVANPTYWVGGRVIMGNGTVSPGAEFSIVNFTTYDNYMHLISVSGIPADTVGSKTFGQVHILDAQSAVVYDAIRLDVNGKVRTPSGMKLAAVQLALAADTVFPVLQITTFPQTEQVRNDTIAAIKSLIAGADNGTTILNWQFHEAIAGVANHTSHTVGWVGIVDPSLGEPVGSATSDLAIPQGTIWNVFGYSINESPLTIHTASLWS